jgi:hypothetical protein
VRHSNLPDRLRPVGCEGFYLFSGSNCKIHKARRSPDRHPFDSATILLSLGYSGFQNSKIAEVAFGSLLHMVQDSFSHSHVTRADAMGAECDGVPGALHPGAIRQIHSYARHDHSAHNSADDAKAVELNRIETTPSVVDVCAQIIRLWSRKASWTEARKYLQYVFGLDPEVLAAGTGEGYRQ